MPSRKAGARVELKSEVTKRTKNKTLRALCSLLFKNHFHLRRSLSRQISRLEELAEQMDQDVDDGDAANYLSRNYSFHFTIYTASDNDELVSIIEGLWAQTGSFLAAGVHLVSLSPDWRRRSRW